MDAGPEIDKSRLLRLFYKHSILISRAEIDIDALDLVALEPDELGVAKTLAILGDTSVGHESLVTLHEDSFEFMPLDPVAAAPASDEVFGLVDRIVVRAGEVEMLRHPILHRVAVTRQIGGKQGADDVGFAAAHVRPPPETCQNRARLPRSHAQSWAAFSGDQDRGPHFGLLRQTAPACWRRTMPAMRH